MAEAEDAAGPSGARRPGYWLPLAVGGLLLAGAVVLYAWTNTWVGPAHGTSTGPHAGIWIGYAPLTRATYFPPPTSWFMSGNQVFLPSFYYLGWYWAVALAAGALLALLWFYRDGRSGPRRAYLATAVVLVALALALPLLTQALPVAGLRMAARAVGQGTPGPGDRRVRSGDSGLGRAQPQAWPGSPGSTLWWRW